MNILNIGRLHSGGIFNGLFGNPKKEKVVSEQYRTYFRNIIKSNPKEVQFLKDKLKEGYILYCPGCGIDRSTCHARIIEQELNFK